MEIKDGTVYCVMRNSTDEVVEIWTTLEKAIKGMEERNDKGLHVQAWSVQK